MSGVLSFLNQDDYQIYNRKLARLCGSVNAAIMLSELVNREQYHSKRNELIFHEKHGRGWFYLTREKAEERTCLSRKEQDTALNKLKKLGLIEQIIHGLPAKRYFRIKVDNILEMFGLSKKESSLPFSDNQHSEKETSLEDQKSQTAHIYKEPQEEPNKESSSETAEAAPSKISFCFKSGEFKNIKQKDYDDWETIYPGLNIESELAKMRRWLIDNPAKSKKKLWGKFITGWLQKNFEKMANRQAYHSSMGGGVDRRQKDENGIPLEKPSNGVVF